jgi:hypothetical protein
MVSELLHRLQTELDRAEAEFCISLLHGWVELPQRQHRLSIGLLIEDNCHSEACRVIVDVGAVIQHQPLAWIDFEVVEAIRVHGAVSGNHVEARSTSRAHVHLSDSAGEPIGTKPLAEGIRIGPRGEHRFACGVKNSNKDDLTIESPRRRIGDGRGTAHWCTPTVEVVFASFWVHP